jgi:hypothetical protein
MPRHGRLDTALWDELDDRGNQRPPDCPRDVRLVCWSA